MATGIVKKVISKVGESFSQPPVVGKVIHTNECKTAEEALAALSKEARTALRETGQWNQEFHGNEIISVIAMYLATRKALEEALLENIS